MIARNTTVELYCRNPKTGHPNNLLHKHLAESKVEIKDRTLYIHCLTMKGTNLACDYIAQICISVVGIGLDVDDLWIGLQGHTRSTCWVHLNIIKNLEYLYRVQHASVKGSRNLSVVKSRPQMLMAA